MSQHLHILRILFMYQIEINLKKRIFIPLIIEYFKGIWDGRESPNLTILGGIYSKIKVLYFLIIVS